MARPRPYGVGPYGKGPYERYPGPWMAPASCQAGVWVPFVPGVVVSVAAAAVPDVRATGKAASI